MADVFLCGALAQAPLLRVVLGVEPGAALTPRILPGYAVLQVPEGPVCGLVARSGASAQGVVLHDAAGDALARVRYFLEVFGIVLRSGSSDNASLLVPILDAAGQDSGTGERPPAGPDPDQAAGFARVAADIMAHRHDYAPDQMAARLPPIRARAQLWVRQQADTRAQADSLSRDVKLHSVHRPYLNFFSVQEADLQFRKADGTMSPVINRAALEIGEAAGVLPYDPRADSVVLIQQFRAPILIGGSCKPWVWEPVAGLVDPGETPEQTAHREAMEEAGLTLWHLEDVGPAYCSPGCLSDRFCLYIGLTDVTRMVEAGGLASENEDIRRAIVPFETFMQRLDDRHYVALPLIMLGLWLARHRDRLRAMA